MINNYLSSSFRLTRSKRQENGHVSNTLRALSNFAKKYSSTANPADRNIALRGLSAAGTTYTKFDDGTIINKAAADQENKYGASVPGVPANPPVDDAYYYGPPLPSQLLPLQLSSFKRKSKPRKKRSGVSVLPRPQLLPLLPPKLTALAIRP